MTLEPFSKQNYSMILQGELAELPEVPTLSDKEKQKI